LESQELKSASVIKEMVVGSPELVVVRCQDLSQELINRDLHLVVGDVVLRYHQAMVVPHSPFLLALLGRVNERVQTVHLEGVTAAAVVALMEFIYTGACIVTAQFASEVQQVQSLLQFQVQIESFVLPPVDQFPHQPVDQFSQVTPAAAEGAVSESAKLKTGKKRQLGENAVGLKLPKKPRMRKEGTKVRGKYSVKIKKEKVESSEQSTELVNDYEKSRSLEEVVETIENRSHLISSQSTDEARMMLPEEESKEYKAQYKKVRDRLWKRRIRDGMTKPFISKEEVEREMVLLPRESKTSKQGTLDTEVGSPNTAFPPSEGTLSSRAVSAEYESVFPPRSSKSVESSSGLISPSPTYPSFPPLPLMLPMSAFKTELLSPFAQLASNISKSAVSTPFESMMPGPTFLPRTLPTNSAELMSSPMSNKLNHHLDQNLGSQDRLFQHMDFPQLTEPNFVYLAPPTTISQSNAAQNGSSTMRDVNNLSSNMDEVSNIADLWSCLPSTEERYSFQFNYDNMV